VWIMRSFRYCTSFGTENFGPIHPWVHGCVGSTVRRSTVVCLEWRCRSLPLLADAEAWGFKVQTRTRSEFEGLRFSTSQASRCP